MFLRSGYVGLYGIERWLFIMEKYLKRQGYNITLVWFHRIKLSEALLNEAKRNNVTIIELPRFGRYDPLTIFRLFALIKKYKIDILHTTDYKSDLIGFFAAKLAKIPIITTVVTAATGGEIVGFKLKVNVAIDKFIIRYFNKIVAVSNITKEELLKAKINNHKIKTIPNGIDIEEIEKIGRATSLPTDNSVKTICFVGRLNMVKRVGDLIFAFKVIKDSFKKNVKLVLIGDGPLRKRLEQLVDGLALNNEVIFMGFCKNRLEFMAKSDVVVLPSIKEGSPLVLLEALALARPVVATDVEGIDELIKQGITGLLVPSKNPKEIARAVIYLLQNRQIAKNIGLAGQEFARRNFTAEIMVQNYEELYKDILKNNFLGEN